MDLDSSISSKSKKKKPIYVRLHTHAECGLKFIPLLHISYIRDYWSVPLFEDVFSGYYVW
jgi:hypothetical protein